MKLNYNIILDFFKKYKYQIYLSILILLVFYPISLFIYIPKWDNINGYLPYRYFISDYIWNGAMPFWNPFQYFGYPGYADLQSGCWYPIVWILNLFGKYNITSLMIELLSCFIIAGLGMYKLSFYMHKSDKTAFILGLSYATSGFMMGSTQLMVFLVGIAWLPWCMFGLLNFFDSLKYRYIILTAVFVSLQITSASPAFTIVLVYLFLFIFGYFILKNIKFTQNLKKILIGGGLLILFITILILPYIQSFIDFAPYFNRADKLEYQSFLLADPFTFPSYISFVFPYTVISNTELFNITDLSLRNAYIGIIGIIGFGFAVFKYKSNNKYYWPLIIGVAISLLLALGDDFFMYKYLYNLPGFGIFRHPSFFRGYTILCLLLLSGFYIKSVFSDEKTLLKGKYYYLSILLVLILLLIFSFNKSSIEEIKANISEIIKLQEFRTTSFYSHLFLNILIILTLITFTFLLKKITKISVFKALIIFVFLDFAVQARLTAPTTIHYNFKHSKVKEYFNALPDGNSQQYNETPFKLLNDTQGLSSTDGIWQNLSTLNKCLSSTGVNPVRFATYDSIKNTDKLNFILENPLLYFPTRFYSKNDSAAIGYIWGTPSIPIFDSANNKISDIVVGYNQFRANITNNSNNKQWLVLNQNYHHLWNAYYSGNKVDITKVNDMVMGVEMPANSNGEIVFTYDSNKIIWFFFISLISYITIIMYFIKRKFYKKFN